MKKLYISCPMKGRTEDAIRHDMHRMHKMAEIVFDQELEVIPTYAEHNPPENVNKAIYCLGESIKKMAEADYFIGAGYLDSFHGCEVEARVAHLYGIPSTFVDVNMMMPDVRMMDNIAYAERMESEAAGLLAPMPLD